MKRTRLAMLARGKARAACLLCLLASIATSIAAGIPAWWQSRGVLNLGGNNQPVPANDFAAVNQGQLKKIATAGYDEIAFRFPGQMGADLTSLDFSLRYGANLTQQPGVTAAQSSTYQGAGAARAIDNNTNGDFTQGSVTHTNADNNPWWQVDLGTSRTIRSIETFNRTDSETGGRTANFYVFISSTDMSTLTLDQLLVAPGVWKSALIAEAPDPNRLIPLSPSQLGRYVMVRIAGTEYLHLAEVKVFGPSPSTTDFAVANLGQVKAVAKPFFNFLTQIGYYPRKKVVVPTSGVVADGMIAHWKFDEGPGKETIIEDSTENVVNGTLSTGAGSSVLREAGTLVFNGNSYAQVPLELKTQTINGNELLATLANTMTISLWVRISAAGMTNNTEMRLLATTTSSYGSGAEITYIPPNKNPADPENLRTSGKLIYGGAPNERLIVHEVDLGDRWHHVALVMSPIFDTGEVFTTFYLDGHELEQYSVTNSADLAQYPPVDPADTSIPRIGIYTNVNGPPTLKTSAHLAQLDESVAPVRFGCSSAPGGNPNVRNFGLKGQLDEVTVFARALSELEIRSLANVHSGDSTDIIQPEYPWELASQGAENYATANIGQLKAVFNFDFDRDTDGDGLPFFWEWTHFGIKGTDPLVDSDGDGLANLAEYKGGLNQGGFNPTNPDSNQNGLSDADDDADGDGLPNYWELERWRLVDWNPTLRTATNDPNLAAPLDADGDGMLNAWELVHGLNPLDLSDALFDPDNDDLTNLKEFTAKTDPAVPDTDRDGLPDGWEVSNVMDPLVYDSDLDPDGDGLSNLAEFKSSPQTNPLDYFNGNTPIIEHFSPSTAVVGAGEISKQELQVSVSVGATASINAPVLFTIDPLVGKLTAIGVNDPPSAAQLEVRCDTYGRAGVYVIIEDPAAPTPTVSAIPVSKATATPVEFAISSTIHLPAPTIEEATPGVYFVSCAVSGSTIRYTRDGTVPLEITDGDAVPADGNITLDADERLVVKAFKAGFEDSEPASLD